MSKQQASNKEKMTKKTKAKKNIKKEKKKVDKGKGNNSSNKKVEKVAKQQRRLVLVAGVNRREYLHNGITTAKYSPWNFVPKFLFEQFRRYSNIFFLLTVSAFK